MPKSRTQKEKDLEELTVKLKQAKLVVLSDYRGTTVKAMDKFRKISRQEHIFCKVYKMTLLRKALEAAGIQANLPDYKVPVILTISDEDETSPARMIKNFAKEAKTINMLEGVADRALISRQQLDVLADLPSRLELRGILVRTINAPIEGFVNVLAGNLRGLMNVLNAIAQKA